MLGRSLSFSGVAVWDTLKTEIERVLGECPGALQCYPDPRSDRGREPPLSIGLAPWATDVARDLHDRFGDDIVLDVGALRFPDRQVRVPVPELAPELDPGEGEVTVDPALEVRSGHTVRSELKVWNRADAELEVVTTGMVFGWVARPEHRVRRRWVFRRAQSSREWSSGSCRTRSSSSPCWWERPASFPILTTPSPPAVGWCESRSRSVMADAGAPLLFPSP